MDRNLDAMQIIIVIMKSLSARRAWIEMALPELIPLTDPVALRKESVDRNRNGLRLLSVLLVALRKESVDRNDTMQIVVVIVHGRSPQGERG